MLIQDYLPVLVAIICASSGYGAELLAIATESLWRELILQRYRWQNVSKNYYVGNSKKSSLTFWTYSSSTLCVMPYRQI